MPIPQPASHLCPINFSLWERWGACSHHFHAQEPTMIELAADPSYDCGMYEQTGTRPCPNHLFNFFPFPPMSWNLCGNLSFSVLGAMLWCSYSSFARLPKPMCLYASFLGSVVFVLFCSITVYLSPNHSAVLFIILDSQSLAVLWESCISTAGLCPQQKQCLFIV